MFLVISFRIGGFKHLSEPIMWQKIALFLPILSSTVAQNLPTEECPLLGPNFPSDFDITQTDAFRDAKSTFHERIEKLFSSGTVNRTHTVFSIDVFSTTTNSSIYSYHHAGAALNNTLTASVVNDGSIYRIGSVSKLFTVYSLLVHSGMDILNHPVTKYLPELGGNSPNKPLEGIIWENILVGTLASQLAGSGGFRKSLASC